MSDFTPTQGRYLSFIYAYILAFGYPPAESEIAKAMKVSPPSVNQMMKTLEKKGLITREAGAARSIKILASAHLIPRWNKRISSTRRVWMRVDPESRCNTTVRSGGPVYRFRITLAETQPPIWRRIETKDVTLKELHGLIQTSMGWTNSHLHCFEVGDKRYTDPQFIETSFNELGETSEAEVRVSDVVSQFGDRVKLRYEYDYGDGWEHVIQLEGIAEAQPRVHYPRCIGGAQACPPEDIGGVWGFVDFVEAVANPDHERHEELLDWYGPFDLTDFDATKATQRMK